ncbi:unnamed protein product, partial [Candidula unifasciata]
MDSDILDSSRSALENKYSEAACLKKDEVPSKVASGKNSDSHLAASTKEEDDHFVRDYVDKKDDSVEGGRDSTSLDEKGGRDSTSLDESSEFNRQLLSLKTTLDNLLENESVSTVCDSNPSEASSEPVIIRSPRRVIEKQQKPLVRQSEPRPVDDNHDVNEEHDDDDDVVVTSYGDYRKPDSDPVRVTGEDTSQDKVEDSGKLSSEVYLRSSEPEILEISLKKDGSGFGFTIAGGVNSGGCYIKQLVSDPAIGDGRLQQGDRILKVNGQYILALNHIDAVTFIRKLPNVAHMQVLRYPQSVEDKETQV